MGLDIFTGDHVPTLLARARAALGPEACVIQVRRRGATFELIAAADARLAPPAQPPGPGVAAAREDVGFAAHLAARLEPPRMVSPAPPTSVPVPVPSALAPSGTRLRPRVVALVGPTGAGKTTTIAKLATHPEAFGAKRVGLLGLDTYRIGAVDQLRTWGDLAGAPVEIVHDDVSLRRGASRLVECDVLLVDTPGRGPRQHAESARIMQWLKMLRPDEVHLTLPAGEMPHVSRQHIATFAPFGVTHLLVTKLDECPEGVRVFDIAVATGHPVRWLTDGQEVPTDLRPAASRLAAAARRRAAGHREAAA